MVLPTIHGNESYGTPSVRTKRNVDMVIDANIHVENTIEEATPDSDAALREVIAAKHAEREAEIAARQAQVKRL